MLRTALLFISLFYASWGVVGYDDYTMEPISSSCAHRFFNTSRASSDDGQNWGLGLLGSHGSLVSKFDFIDPPWTSFGVEFQGYYTSPADHQCTPNAPAIQQQIDIGLYDSDLQRLHSVSKVLNFTTFPHEYKITWNNLCKQDKSPLIHLKPVQI